ncbi:hypothetical protein, partial [Bacillus sp. 220_BSPC]
ELSTQIDLLTENETKMKAQHQQLKDELQTVESEYLELQLEVEQLTEINQTYQNTVIQIEKENNELIGKNNQLKSNQEKERIQFQESLEQINDEKNELKSTTLELERELKDEKRVSQELSTQINLLTENETKIKAQQQQDQQSFKKVIQ